MSIEDIRARTVKRRSEGADQTYPEHRGRAPARISLPVSRSECDHEGAILEHCHTCQGSARSVRECDIHERATRVHVSDRVRSCDRCPDYKRAADENRTGGAAPDVGGG